MSLTASSSVVLIPSSVPSGNVTISWNFSFDIMLEERLTKVGSTAVFTRRSIPDTQTQVGFYVQALTPGDVYEVRAFRRGFNPAGMSDAEASRWTLGWVIVHALGLSAQLESDRNERVGGTFYRYSCATAPTPTHGFMEVGKDAPTADAAGFLTMANPIMTLKMFTPTTLHHLSTDKIDMLPEDRVKLTDARFALIRVSDALGRWQQIVRPVKTLRRVLTIDFNKIDVQSLGEAPSETSAEMRFKMEVWDFNAQPPWTVVKSFAFENHNSTLVPFPVRDYVLNPVFVVGPRPVDKRATGLALHVQEFDPWPFEDEFADSLSFGRPRTIEVKPGENIEDQPINMVIKAAQAYDPFDTEQEISVDLHVTVTVAHVP